ncbi:cadherin EGF LAG seven-pass G-type receptor 1 isoform X1 [Octopus sinensis]|uniref:Cadherin EGF LAG seven-pass G-type receptor 1 isoform X1 n=1 Tax=Octopus sinensis TaxID=2607531 RepID=A0A6P7SKD1_9MOLL|nr:cadherin EGF LAG seven-pass G-type receptor 1 isoform X1 [Octopus sinensis]
MKLCLIITSFAALFSTVNSIDAVKSACSSGINGYTYRNWTGIIQSPNFERGTYENNERCEWRIRLSAGSRVKLTFRHFELEEPQSANAKKCWDYIELLDGPENHRTLLTKKCGRSQPETVISKTNEVALNFFSDNSKVYKGFEIEYVGVCENTITELKALIESPGYPELPPPGVVCKWTLKGDKDNRPAVEVKSIKHYFKICSHSGLKITDLPHQDRTDYLCKNHSGLKFSGGPALQITYDPREATRITKFVLNVSHVGSNPCEISPCLNEGNCLDLGNNFNCLCRPGFSGAKCESDIYECESNPCQNNGVCRDFINGFMCTCPYGYTGSTCETPINTCRGISCLNGGICVADSEDTYHCDCLGGYTGPVCENRTDGVIPGQTCKMIKCQNGGSCLPYKEGGFVCKCPAGVMGPYCEVVTGKECDKNPCSADATCVATTNDDDEISEHNPGFKCLCPEGRIGQFCENYVDHCLINECHNGASCSSVANTFYCSCTSGLKGRLCEHDIDECLDNPCENGGRCENAYGTYSCDCKKGFTGYNCSTNLNDCTVNSCQNGGTCIDRINGYACKCPFNFWGKKCQHKRYPCDHKPCKNGGVCVSYKASFYCECKQGFTGKTCSDLLDPCNPQPCQNNGKCVYEPVKGDLKCVCPPGILGTLCELRNECFSSPCLNGARCLEQLGKYVCKCAPGFYGKHCQTKKTTCIPNPCTHGGRCIQLTNIFQCQCTKNYDGQTCSHFKYTDTLHCPEEVDSFNGSGILWFGTQVGYHDIQPCPPGVLGNATRQCFEDNSVPDVRATWGRPDLSNCVHKKFLDIKKKAEQLLLSERVTTENINEVSNTIFDIVENKSNQKLQLYPGDLGVAVDTFGIMADVVGEASDDDVDMQPTIEAFGKTVGSVIDQSVVPVWRNANPNMVGEKMASVLANTERMASNVFQHGHRGSTQSYSMASTNLDFSISTVEDVYTGDKLKRSETSSIRLPDEVYDICRRENKGRPVGLFNARFTSIGQILSFKQDRPNSLNDTRIINSDVITSSVVGVARSKFQRLSSPIILVFQLKDENIRGNFNESCVFMNMNATNRFDRWQYKGCYLAKKTAGYTECHCYHMTNFALLMDVHGIGEKIDDRHQIALSFISYIGGALSILGCVLSVFAFEYFRLSSDRVRIHENLAVSIILVQLIFLIGIDRKDSPVACKVVAIFLHYVMMAMFCWMLVEGIHLYIVLVKVFKTGSHLKKYAAIGWGVPLVIVGIPVALAFDNYGQGNICWMTSSSLLVLFVPTVALVIVLNTIVLAIVIRVMLRSFRSSHRAIAEETSAVRVGLKATAVLLPLLGLTWTFGFLSVDSSSTLVFTYIFTILNCLQGLFFFIFHCLMNIDVRNAIKRKYFGRKRSTMSAGRKSSVDFETYGEFSSGGKKLVRDSSTSVATNTTDLCSFERKRATLSEKHPNLLNKSTNCNGEVSRNGSVSAKTSK